MTKESKVKGKVWVPEYIQRSTDVQQTFGFEKVRKHPLRKSVLLKDIPKILKEQAGMRHEHL
jgi:hypothetical protein